MLSVCPSSRGPYTSTCINGYPTTKVPQGYPSYGNNINSEAIYCLPFLSGSRVPQPRKKELPASLNQQTKDNRGLSNSGDCVTCSRKLSCSR